MTKMISKAVSTEDEPIASLGFPVGHLLTSPKACLENFFLARASVVSNLRKEIKVMQDHLRSAEVEVEFARWLLANREDLFKLAVQATREMKRRRTK